MEVCDIGGGGWVGRLASGVLALCTEITEMAIMVDLGRINQNDLCEMPSKAVSPSMTWRYQVDYVPFLRESHNVKEFHRAGRRGLQPHHFRSQTTQPLESNYPPLFFFLTIIHLYTQEVTVLYGHSKSICKSSLKTYSSKIRHLTAKIIGMKHICCKAVPGP